VLIDILSLFGLKNKSEIKESKKGKGKEIEGKKKNRKN